MTDVCKLNFEITVNVPKEFADELGKDLAVFLEESWFNGEDVTNVKYIGHDLIKK